MAQFALRNGVPQCTLANFEQDFAGRHTLQGVLAYWASRKPEAVALIAADTGQEITWEDFDRTTTALAGRLLDIGFERGDFLAAALPFLIEHVFLAYACFKIGVVHAPIDLRLKAPEVIRCVDLIQAKGFALLGETAAADFRELGKAVQTNCGSIKRLLQFSAPHQALIAGAIPGWALLRDAQALADAARSAGPARAELTTLGRAAGMVREEDGAQVIFTTGSTGYPKPALLSHRSITCQNMCLGAAFRLGEASRAMVNLPPSHVGGQAEQVMTPLFYGGCLVLLPAYDPARTLKAIQDYKVTFMGQIPALFNLEWRLPGYDSFDLSSLDMVLYGGQQVPRAFLERLMRMARRAGTGLGLTETSGFCTYTPIDGPVDDLLLGLGYDMPVYPLTIRAPMTENGLAGKVLPAGEVGYICFQGPQTFLGYVGDPVATASAIARDGVLYTGDLGCQDETGLHFAGRARWMIKPKGFQVFPGQVEDHLCELRDKVAAAGVVGAEHDVFVEAIVAFVERRPGADLTESELQKHAEGIASYMRPLHYVLLDAGELPLNRVAKIDYVRLDEMARQEIARLREQGGWDRQ